MLDEVICTGLLYLAVAKDPTTFTIVIYIKSQLVDYGK